jgi:hypothetical protein
MTPHWNQPLIWDRDAAAGGIRPRVLCQSPTGWLDETLPVEALADLLDMIRRTPNLNWLLPSKVPGCWQHRLDHVRCERQHTPEHRTVCRDLIIPWLNGDAPPNVWTGATIDDQASADQRTFELLQIPARSRFLNCELRESVFLRDIDAEFGDGSLSDLCDAPDGWNFPDIQLVLCRRLRRISWARSIQHQCADAGVPFFLTERNGGIRDADFPVLTFDMEDTAPNPV